MIFQYTKTTNSMLKLARADLLAADILLKQKMKTVYPQVGFHCQQSVEKSIKAFLNYRKLPYKHVHNLESFRESLFKTFPGIKSEFQKSLRLIPFAVKFRYEDLDVGSISSKEIKALFGNAKKMNALILKEIVKTEKKNKSTAYLSDWTLFME